MGVEGESTQTAATSVDGGDNAEINVNIRCANANKFSVRSTLRSTVVDFKDLLAQNCDVPANQQRLIYKGRILKDDQTLNSYGLQADHTVHMVRGGSAPAPVTGAPAATAAGAPPFPGLGSELPELEQVQQQQLPQNPDMLRDMMNMPEIQYMLNNPEIVRVAIMEYPQLLNIILNHYAILREELKDLSSRCDGLETGQNDVAKAYKDLAKANKDLAKAHDDLRSQVNELTTRVTALENGVALASTTIAELQARLKAAKAGRTNRRKTGGSEPSGGEK